MKWLKYAFYTLGFAFQYVIPLLLFGGVVPYTHDGIRAGLTGMGYIAIIIFCLIVGKKIKEKLLQRPKSLLRGIFLSLFPIAMWLIVNIGLGWIIGFVDEISLYWDKIILFIVLGRLFYTIEEAIVGSEVKNNGKDK